MKIVLPFKHPLPPLVATPLRATYEPSHIVNVPYTVWIFSRNSVVSSQKNWGRSQIVHPYPVLLPTDTPSLITQTLHPRYSKN